MDITIVHVADCPHLDLARQRLETALDEIGLHATIHHRLVTTEHEATTAGLRGSPTILIDGHDPFADNSPATGLACRLYRTEAGPQGAPSVPMLTKALRAHRHRSPLDRPLDGDLTRQIRWAAFERLRTGQAITANDLADQLEVPTGKIATALDELTRAGLVERDLRGAVIGAHGLTLTETRHHLVLDGIPLYTWCALDAIGIPAALGTDADITTRCGWCDQSLTLTIHAGTPEALAERVLWLRREPCTNVLQQFCPHPTSSATTTTSTTGAPKPATPTGTCSPSPTPPHSAATGGNNPTSPTTATDPPRHASALVDTSAVSA